MTRGNSNGNYNRIDDGGANERTNGVNDYDECPKEFEFQVSHCLLRKISGYIGHWKHFDKRTIEEKTIETFFYSLWATSKWSAYRVTDNQDTLSWFFDWLIKSRIFFIEAVTSTSRHELQGLKFFNPILNESNPHSEFVDFPIGFDRGKVQTRSVFTDVELVRGASMIDQCVSWILGGCPVSPALILKIPSKSILTFSPLLPKNTQSNDWLCLRGPFIRGNIISEAKNTDITGFLLSCGATRLSVMVDIPLENIAQWFINIIVTDIPQD